MTTDKTLQIPNHIGFIVDGNRRWAKKYGLPTYEGHLAGHNALKEVLRAAVEKGVKYISFYVFSTENWKRSEEEVSKLMNLILKVLKDDLKELTIEQARVKIVGTRQGLSDKVIKAIEKAEETTRHFKKATVAFCFNYGGQLEIAEAAKKCLQDGLKADEITPEAISDRLYSPEIPPVDVIVRTSGEQRLSNFMLWRAAYSEFIFLDKFWPDMTKNDVDDIIKEFNRRNRRFGGN